MWWALAGAILIVLLARRVLAGYLPTPPTVRALARPAYAVVQAAGDATFPSGGAIEASGSEARVGEHTDEFVAAQPPHLRVLITLLLLLVEHATLVFPAPGAKGMRRFSSLTPEQRIAYLVGWQTSRLFPRRLVFTSLRAIVTMAYFADPRVMHALALDPPEIETPVIEADLLWPRIGEHPRTIRFNASDVGTPRSAVLSARPGERET